MKVTLIGEDKRVHVSGELDTEILASSNILVRNGRYYVMRHLSTTDGVVFQETIIPWDVTAILTDK